MSNNSESTKEWERIEHHMRTEIFNTNVKGSATEMRMRYGVREVIGPVILLELKKKKKSNSKSQRDYNL